MTLGEFAEAVRAYALLTNASATSWGRTTQRNQAVGGVLYSAHRVWLACDLVYDEPVVPKDQRIIIADRLGLKVLDEGDHDHLQPKSWVPG